MARWLVEILICFSVVACGAKTRGSVLASSGAPGVSVEGLRLFEEQDGRLTLDLRARTAVLDPRTQEGSFRDIEARFDLPEGKAQGVTLSAASARLSAGGRWLDFEGQVRARDAAGRTLAAERARFDRIGRHLEVPVPATASFPNGQARGAQGSLDVGNERLSLEGGVEAEVRP